MAATAFDSLSYARRLKAAGVSDEQAEAQAELMAEAFIFNRDSLVTRDYLKATLDARLSAFEMRVDRRFSVIENGIDVFSSVVDGKFRLVYWMLGIVIASTTIPQLITLFAG